MEEQKEDSRMLRTRKSIKLFDWLIEKGFGLEEAGWVLCYVHGGDYIGLAMLKVLSKRRERLEKIYEKGSNGYDWGTPITP